MTANDAFQAAPKMQSVPDASAGRGVFQESASAASAFAAAESRGIPNPRSHVVARSESADVFYRGARLGIIVDPASGEVRGIRYRGRNREGHVARIVENFTPQSYSVEVDPRLPADTFVRPVFEKK